ncbi:unnamed protein product [Durusdinium trenchii]|uniref:Uncharacterized protein n=1 Tax=Durusdinium trenchii TaxID=1381693 RepID=A0ABP0NMZ8_9DINO
MADLSWRDIVDEWPNEPEYMLRLKKDVQSIAALEKDEGTTGTLGEQRGFKRIVQAFDRLILRATEEEVQRFLQGIILERRYRQLFDAMRLDPNLENDVLSWTGIEAIMEWNLEWNRAGGTECVTVAVEKGTAKCCKTFQAPPDATPARIIEILSAKEELHATQIEIPADAFRPIRERNGVLAMKVHQDKDEDYQRLSR